MKYAVAFLLFSVVMFFHAVSHRGPWLLLIWPATSFLVVGLAYGWLGPRVFGKRPDGTLAPLAFVLLLPYLLFAWGTWHVQRLLSREPPAQEIVPGLWIGRRPLRGEVPPSATTVVDLTAEFRTCHAACGERTYRCLPTLDARPADRDAFVRLARGLAGEPSPVFVHCAQGHGRSGMLVAAILLARGAATSVDDALVLIRRVRPGVRLNHAQRSALERTVPHLLAPKT